MNQNPQNNIQTYNAGARFGLTPIPRHIHNGTDSPLVYQPQLTYVGILNSNATSQLLPGGWTCTKSGTGTYVVTHNLNTNLYFVVPTVHTTGLTFASVAAFGKNTFTVSTWLTGGSTNLADSDWGFILLDIRNKLQILPSYTGSLT